MDSYRLLCTANIIVHKDELLQENTTYEINILYDTVLLISMKVYTGVEILLRKEHDTVLHELK
jgi:hypothetical protein